jgi:hypothetical protein
VAQYLINIVKFQDKQKEIIGEAKSMFTRQTQQIMKLLEVQIKYGINVVNAEDEISDFDLDKALQMQNKLDEALQSMNA